MSNRAQAASYQPAEAATGNAYAVFLGMGAGKQYRTSIRNTHATNGLHYKVTGYLRAGGILTRVIVAETLIAALTTVNLADIPETYDQVVIEVKSSVADTPATVKAEAIHEVFDTFR